MTRRVLRLLLPVSLLALMGVTAQAQAASDYFITIAGIPGDVTQKSAPNAIEANTVSWSIVRSGPRLDDFVFTHKVDSASPLLLQAAATGNHISSAHFEVFTSGATQERQLDYCLEDVVVKSIKVEGTDTAGLPVETVDLNPSSFEERFQPINPNTGQPGDPVLFGWDIVNGHSIGFNDTCGQAPPGP
jgi:type VI secretion system secreted protein Hcp